METDQDFDRLKAFYFNFKKYNGTLKTLIWQIFTYSGICWKTNFTYFILRNYGFRFAVLFFLLQQMV